MRINWWRSQQLINFSSGIKYLHRILKSEPPRLRRWLTTFCLWHYDIHFSCLHLCKSVLTRCGDMTVRFVMDADGHAFALTTASTVLFAQIISNVHKCPDLCFTNNSTEIGGHIQIILMLVGIIITKNHLNWNLNKRWIFIWSGVMVDDGLMEK